VVQTAQQGYSQSLQEYNQLYSSFTNAEELADNALNIMRDSGINPTDVRYASKKIADVKRQLSSIQQQKFDTALQEAKNAFSGIVSVQATLCVQQLQQSGLLALQAMF